ncbi:hypothetical protein GQ55_5G239100 [Panicum hallii var. hallii]|uniref:Uncharacterized protein n=1 Tax=Panicum hallii var. hallii TaxID=1504633 RepID=A0A2T7DJM4_9POAL|nr:hypothetical protein GQ55_5G239100 [Panicum hallii var. hallii]
MNRTEEESRRHPPPREPRHRLHPPVCPSSPTPPPPRSHDASSPRRLGSAICQQRCGPPRLRRLGGECGRSASSAPGERETQGGSGGDEEAGRGQQDDAGEDDVFLACVGFLPSKF